MNSIAKLDRSAIGIIKNDHSIANKDVFPEHCFIMVDGRGRREVSSRVKV
jgi:hypothetical protein